MCVLGTIGGVLREVLGSRSARMVEAWLPPSGCVPSMGSKMLILPRSLAGGTPPSTPDGEGENGVRDWPFVQDPLFGDNGAYWTLVVHGTGRPRVGSCQTPGVVW